MRRRGTPHVKRRQRGTAPGESRPKGACLDCCRGVATRHRIPDTTPRRQSGRAQDVLKSMSHDTKPVRQLTVPAVRAGLPMPGPVRLRIAVRGPYDVAWMLGFLGKRVIPELESVHGTCYRRLLAGANDPIEARATARTVSLAIPTELRNRARELRAAARRVFDLDADSAVIDAHLGKDRRLRAAIRRSPGLRVPGAFDGFELAVRAILGQQVSVARATALARLSGAALWRRRAGAILVPVGGLPRAANAIGNRPAGTPRRSDPAARRTRCVGRSRNLGGDASRGIAQCADRHCRYRPLDRAVHRDARRPGCRCVSGERLGDSQTARHDAGRRAARGRGLAAVSRVCSDVPVGVGRGCARSCGRRARCRRVSCW